MSKQILADHLLYGRLALEIDGFDSLAELALDLRWSWNLIFAASIQIVCGSNFTPTV